MFRIYILQKLYDVSEMRIMTAVIDTPTFSKFCRIDSTNQIPAWDTIGSLRNVLVLVKKRYTRKVVFTFDSTIISTLFTIYMTKPIKAVGKPKQQLILTLKDFSDKDLFFNFNLRLYTYLQRPLFLQIPSLLKLPLQAFSCPNLSLFYLQL